MSFAQLYPKDEVANVEASVGQVMSDGTWTGNLTLKRQDGTTLPVRLLTFVMYNSQGQPASLSGMFHDLTSQQQAEEERETLQQQIIDAQRSALRELSTPLIPLSSSVVLMPLIGSVDTARAQQVMETLLEGIAMYQADTAILDITGVSVVDTQVANALIQTAQAVRLLGAQVVLTGIGAVMAQTLVHLGADLSSIVTRGSLQNGIAYALSEEGNRRERGDNGA
jgi:rsbT co-antagonist protein RsbR